MRPLRAPELETESFYSTLLAWNHEDEHYQFGHAPSVPMSLSKAVFGLKLNPLLISFVIMYSRPYVEKLMQ